MIYVYLYQDLLTLINRDRSAFREYLTESGNNRIALDEVIRNWAHPDIESRIYPSYSEIEALGSKYDMHPVRLYILYIKKDFEQHNIIKKPEGDDSVFTKPGIDDYRVDIPSILSCTSGGRNVLDKNEIIYIIAMLKQNSLFFLSAFSEKIDRFVREIENEFATGRQQGKELYDDYMCSYVAFIEKEERFSHLLMRQKDLETRMNAIKIRYYSQMGRLEHEYELLKSDNDCLVLAIKIKKEYEEKTKEQIDELLKEERKKQKEVLDNLKSRIIAEPEGGKTRSIDLQAFKDAKRLYRKLASQLHPDLYAPGERPDLFNELWIELQNAFNSQTMKIDYNSLINIELCLEAYNKKISQANERMNVFFESQEKSCTFKEMMNLYKQFTAKPNHEELKGAEHSALQNDLWAELKKAFNVQSMNIDMEKLLEIEKCLEEHNNKSLQSRSHLNNFIGRMIESYKEKIAKLDTAIENLLLTINVLEESKYLTELIYLIDNPDRMDELKAELLSLIESEKARAKKLSFEYFDLF